jgi:hypothetical protein
LHGLVGVLGTEGDGVRRRVGIRRRRVPQHAEHRRFGLDLPAVGRRAGPALAVEVFALLAIRRQSGEVGLLRIGEGEDRRKAAGVAARAAGAAGELRVRPGQCGPEDRIEKREAWHALIVVQRGGLWTD